MNASYLKPRAKGRNIVDQQYPTLLDVTCCVCLHTLLKVACCLKPIKLLATCKRTQQLPTVLRPFARSSINAPFRL